MEKDILTKQKNLPIKDYFNKCTVIFDDAIFNALGAKLIEENKDIPEDILDKYFDKFNNDQIFTIYKRQKLSEEFIEKHWYRICTSDLIRYQTLSEEFIDKHSECFNNDHWKIICSVQKLSEEFIERHLENLDFHDILVHQKLSEGFIEKYINIFLSIDNQTGQHKLSDAISKNQRLSEDFIDRHHLHLNWSLIAMHQKLSEEFIEKHFNCLPMSSILSYQNVSESFIDKYFYKINMYTLENMDRVPIALLRRIDSYVNSVKTNSYECEDDT